MPSPCWAAHVIRRNATGVLDLGQNRLPLHEANCSQRRAEVRLAKHGSERPTRRGSACATNQSTAETWRKDLWPSFRAPQRRLQGGGQAARVPLVSITSCTARRRLAMLFKGLQA